MSRLIIRSVAEETEGDRLYALPLEEFTAARDALAARLRSAGDAQEASQVKALRKPTTPAWAVNQLARRQRELIEQLIAGSERMRRAQQELLQGGPAQEVWEATLAEREVLARLSHEAERILSGANYGVTRGMLDRITDTLAAAAADVGGRTLLRRGILTNEMRRAGFGDILGAPPEAPSRERAPAKPAKTAKLGKAAASAPSAKQRLEADREAARLARDAERADAEAERLDRAASKAEEDADALRRRLAGAEKDASRVRAEATAARKAAATARREADRAADRLAKLGGPRSAR